MGPGTIHDNRTPDSRTETTLKQRPYIADKILQHLKEFNDALLQYVQLRKIALPVENIAALPPSLEEGFVEYEGTLQFIAEKVFFELEAELDQLTISAPIIKKLQPIYDHHKTLYKYIKGDIKQYCDFLAQSSKENALIVAKESNQCLFALERIVEKLERDFNPSYRHSRRFSRKSLVEDETTAEASLDSETVNHPLSIRAEDAKQPLAAAQVQFDTALHSKQTAVDQAFEWMLAAHGDQMPMQNALTLPSEGSQKIVEQVNALLIQAEILKDEVTLWSDIVSDCEKSGFDIKAMQTVFEEQWSNLGKFKQQVEENGISALSAPNLINKFSFCITSLYEKSSIGAILWRGHFELYNQPVTRSFSNLEQAIDRLKVLCHNEWHKQSEQPTWDIHTLLDAIKNVFFYQQHFVFKQTMFLGYIKEMTLDATLFGIMQDMDLYEIPSLSDSHDNLSDTSSVRTGASFFGHSRNTSLATSVGSDLPVADKSSDLDTQPVEDLPSQSTATVK